MFETKADTLRNYLYIKIDGTQELEEGREAANAVLEEAKKLKPGFTIIDDLSRVSAVTPDLLDELGAVQLVLTLMGAKRDIRIVPSDAAPSRSWRVAHPKAGYETVEVTSFEDAIKSL